MQMEASHIVTSVMRCNAVHQFLGTEEQARSAGYYTVKYCCKDPTKINILVPVLYMVDKKRESKADDAGVEGSQRDTLFWLQRALNNFTSMSEFSDTQIASALMGTDSYHTSHIFWSFHSKSFVNYQRKRKNFNETDIQPVAPSIIDDNIHHVLPQDGSIDDDDRDTGETIYRSKDGKLRVAMQHEHYMRRSEELKDLSPYEWVCLIHVVKKPKTTEPSTTRQRNAAFEFEDDGKGWHETHYQVLRSKFVVLHCGVF